MANLDMEYYDWLISGWKKTNPAASRCRNMIFQNRHRCFKFSTTLTYDVNERLTPAIVVISSRSKFFSRGIILAFFPYHATDALCKKKLKEKIFLHNFFNNYIKLSMGSPELVSPTVPRYFNPFTSSKHSFAPELATAPEVEEPERKMAGAGVVFEEHKGISQFSQPPSGSL